MKFDKILNYYLAQVGLEAEHEQPARQDVVPASEQLIMLIPLKHVVVFPGLVSHFKLPRKKAKLLEKKAKEQGAVGVIGLKKYKNPETVHHLEEIGTVVDLQKVIHMPEGQESLLIVQGKVRFRPEELLDRQMFPKARVTTLPMKRYPINKGIALSETLKEVALELFRQLPDIPEESYKIVEEIQELSFLTAYIATNLGDPIQKQELLNTNSHLMRGRKLLRYLSNRLEVFKIKSDLQQQVSNNLNQKQRDHVLREHMRVLQEQLGENTENELKKLQHALSKNGKIPLEVREHLQRQARRAERCMPQSPEYSNLINYIQTVLEMPWGIYTKDKKDLVRAQKLLDKNHYGMQKVKDRIIEYLAVRQLRGSNPRLMLCIIGPPGVGKTTLGLSVAAVLGRKVAKISLGGLYDESEIRGHRRVYLGAQPGKILQQLQKVKSANPVLILDEVDKLGKRHGDPAAALLEVLDMAQNHAFVDNFMEVPFDLSDVLFIATANTKKTIPEALADRMEFIELEGYSREEKVEIAEKHLFPNLCTAHGLSKKALTIAPDVLTQIIRDYTMEAGVRDLKTQLGSIVRKTVKLKVMKQPYDKKIELPTVRKMLGESKVFTDLYEDPIRPGVSIGLAWTSVGGEIFFIETALTAGEGKLTLSGQLGDVMEESAVAAHTYLKSEAGNLGIDPLVFSQYDLHIHIPDGATPKDGPSAGIALYSALASLYTQRKVQKHLAMSGEITLRGRILPVGGIKEKLLAAKRAGVQRVILSKKNQRDVKEIPPHYLKGLEIEYIEEAYELLEKALDAKQVAHPRIWKVTPKGPQKTA